MSVLKISLKCYVYKQFYFSVTSTSNFISVLKISLKCYVNEQFYFSFKDVIKVLCQ